MLNPFDSVQSYFGEEIHIKKLINGLTVYIMPKPFFARKYAYLATQYGGFYNDYLYDGVQYRAPKGIAHFLEHQIFESTGKSNFEKFEALGANLNAYTSSTSTVYHFDCIDHFDSCLSMLKDMVFQTSITEATVNKEKDIIEQEIRMYMDEPEWDLNNNLMNGLYERHPIKEDIAGTVESVQNTTKDEILRSYEHFYTPQNMSLFIYGEVNLKETIALVEQIFGTINGSENQVPKLVLNEESLDIQYKRKETTKDVSKGMVLMGFKGNPDYFMSNRELKLGALKIANDLMFGRSSAFFMASYEAGLVADAFDFDIQIGEGYAMGLVGNETDHQDVLYENILITIQKHQTEGFDEEDFIRMKRKILGRTVASFNSLQSIASHYTHSVMNGSDMFKQMEAYKNITLTDVMTSLNQFYKLDQHTVSIIRKK